jgi:hypothetical protein
MTGGVVARTSEVRTTERSTWPRSLGDLVAREPDQRVRAPRSGAVHALNVRRIVRFASGRDLTCVMPHTVGDFVTRGGVLIEVYALLADLELGVSPANRPAVRHQLDVLDLAVPDAFADVEDEEFASIEDRQGIGGVGASSRSSRARRRP